MVSGSRSLGMAGHIRRARAGEEEAEDERDELW